MYSVGLGCVRPSDGIVGFWHVAFVAQGNTNGIPDGTTIDSAYVQWHSDGTEIMNSSRDPRTGNFCLGVWKRTGAFTYTLKHLALSWDGSGTPVGPPRSLRMSNWRTTATASQGPLRLPNMPWTEPPSFLPRRSSASLLGRASRQTESRGCHERVCHVGRLGAPTQPPSGGSRTPAPGNSGRGRSRLVAGAVQFSQQAFQRGEPARPQQLRPISFELAHGVADGQSYRLAPSRQDDALRPCVVGIGLALEIATLLQLVQQVVHCLLADARVRGDV